MHRKVYRPWGAYDSIDMGDRFQVKRITVKPGAQLSLQMHHHRAEHWIVVKGTAVVTNGDQEILLTENQSTYIPIGVVHRLENPGAGGIWVRMILCGLRTPADELDFYWPRRHRGIENCSCIFDTSTIHGGRTEEKTFFLSPCLCASVASFSLPSNIENVAVIPDSS